MSKKSLWIEAENFPLPRKLSGRAVKIWACISLLYYASQERKPIFLKTQRIYFLSPQCECELPTRVGSALCAWSLLCLSLLVNISFTPVTTTETWKRQGQGGHSEFSSGLFRDDTEHLWSQLWCELFLRQGRAGCSTAWSPLQPQSLIYPKPAVLNEQMSLNAQKYTRARSDLDY